MSALTPIRTPSRLECAWEVTSDLMIVTAVILFVFAFGIVQWTNSKFAGAESHGETTKH